MAQPPKKPTVWYVKQGGKVYGPFDSARLKKLADANKIRRDSEVTKQLPGPWAKAERVRGLFDDEDSAHSDNEGLTVRSGVEGKPSGAFARLLRRPSSPVELPKRPGGDARWYYREIGRDDEDAKGPHTTAEMDRLVDKGTVRASTLVLRAGDSRWETAFSAGLFLDDPQESDADVTTGSTQSTSQKQTAQPDCVSRGQESSDGTSEKVLWSAKPSHHANYFAYSLCALTAPLLFPIYWGLRRYVERDCTRYQITTRRVQIKRGADHTKRQDIPLENIRDARLACPASLQTTHLCNVELIGTNAKRPLAVLEGIPLDQSAFVISLCEAAVHRHIPTQLNGRLVLDIKAQEAEIRRRAELRHEQEQARLRAQVRAAEQRAFDAEQRARARASHPGAVDSWQDSLAAHSGPELQEWLPPPPKGPKPQKVSGLTALLFGASKQTRTIWVKGHYRGKTWVKAHERHIKA